MFNSNIVKATLESALNCHKEDIFKYVYLTDDSISLFATSFIEEDKNRERLISYDDVYQYLVGKLTTNDYKCTSDRILINPSIFSQRDLFLSLFNNWIINNPNSSYLIPEAHQTNLEILDLLTKTFNNNLDQLVTERLAMDLQILFSNPSYKKYKAEYESCALSILSNCSNGDIFSSILKSVDDSKFKDDIFQIIFSSEQKDTISVQVVSQLGVNNVPATILEDFVQNVKSSYINLGTFISILDIIPLSKFTTDDTSANNATFNKLLELINDFINTNNVSAELVNKIKEAASPFTQNGLKLLQILTAAVNVFLIAQQPVENLSTTTIPEVTTSNTENQVILNNNEPNDHSEQNRTDNVVYKNQGDTTNLSNSNPTFQPQGFSEFRGSDITGPVFNV